MSLPDNATDEQIIQFHASAIQNALLAAHEDLDRIQNRGLLGEATHALEVTHAVADGAWRRLKRRCPEETDGVELLSGGGK